MNLAEIKTALGISKFELAETKDQETNTPTGWLRHWDNINRKSVVMHKELFTELKADTQMSIDNLACKHEVKSGAKGEYDNYVLIRYTPTEFTL